MQVVEGFDKQQRESLLMFVTSCSRPPLLGFRELHPNFCIQKTSHSPEEADSRLPTAATCMNMLKLPCYNSADACRDRLLYAINAGAGFELS
jgi:ubiquitin-protein ligase E3 C